MKSSLARLTELQFCQPRTAAATTASVALAPSASPFSKSPSVYAMEFVTCAKQTMGFPLVMLKAYRAAASISTASVPKSRARAMAASVSR